MATGYSQPSRSDRRRRETVEEALAHAVEVMTREGVGALTVSEVARRLGMRPPSLYKYFPSLHALYDALFLRGITSASASVEAATAGLGPGLDRLRAGGRAYVRWAVENPALAQLLHWRVVPGFEPSAAAWARAEGFQEALRAELRAAVAAGELDEAAATAEGERLWTVLLSGLMTQQMANQPAASFDEGLFTSLTEPALDLFLRRFAPSRPSKEES